MSSKIKALGLTLAAVFAISAVAAQAASAVTHTFTSDQENVVLTGAQEEGKANELILATSGEFVKCNEANYHGTATLPATTVTVHPIYNECFSGLAPNPGEVVVDTEGCNYDLTGETVEDPKTGKFHAPVHVECETGKEIHVTVEGACTLNIPKQTPTTGGVTYETTVNPITEKKDVTVQATASGIHYNAEGPLCFLIAEEGTGTDGNFTSSITVEGFEDLGPGHTPTEHGGPVDFTVE
jgi:hypothetical protein